MLSIDKYNVLNQNKYMLDLIWMHDIWPFSSDWVQWSEISSSHVDIYCTQTGLDDDKIFTAHDFLDK